ARTYRISTVEFAKRIATESDRPGLAMIKDALGLPGGLPIKVGNDTIGVAGAPGGNGDVACAEAAIEAIKDQLK
ncbi:MAG TPA: heme-binding protein, partial [Vicinamibacterales bacterium]|nr:heme-binding protein [Vicinamibacterales bacterium]